MVCCHLVVIVDLVLYVSQAVYIIPASTTVISPCHSVVVVSPRAFGAQFVRFAVSHYDKRATYLSQMPDITL